MAQSNANDKNCVFQFSVGEELLCYYNQKLYEAKCLKRLWDPKEKAMYFIHYKGWKRNWDSWVNEDNLLVKNETNLIHMKKLNEMQSKRGKNRSPLFVHENNTILVPKKGLKRRILEDSSESNEIELDVPSILESSSKKRGRPRKIPKYSSKKETENTKDLNILECVVVLHKLPQDVKASEKIININECIADNSQVLNIDKSKVNSETVTIPIVKTTDKMDIGKLCSKTITQKTKLTKNFKDKKLSSVNKKLFKDIVSKAFETKKSIPENYKTLDIEMAKIVDGFEDNSGETVTTPIEKTTDKRDISNLDLKNMNTPKTKKIKQFKDSKLLSKNKISLKDIENRTFETNKSTPENFETLDIEMAKIVDGFEDNSDETVKIPIEKTTDKRDINNLDLKNMNISKTKKIKQFKDSKLSSKNKISLKDIENRTFETNKSIPENYNTMAIEIAKFFELEDNFETVTIPSEKTTDERNISNLHLKTTNTPKTKQFETSKHSSITKISSKDIGNSVLQTNKVVPDKTFKDSENETTKVIDEDNSVTVTIKKITEKRNSSNLDLKNMSTPQTKQPKIFEAKKHLSVNKISFKDIDNKPFATNKIIPETSEISKNAIAKTVIECDDRSESVANSILKTTDKIDFDNLHLKNMNTQTKQPYIFEAKNLKTSVNKTSFKDVGNRILETNQIIHETSKTPKNAMTKIIDECKKKFKTVTIPFVKTHKMDIGNLHLKNMNPPKTKQTKTFETKQFLSTNKKSFKDIGNKPFANNKVMPETSMTSENAVDMIVDELKDNSETVINSSVKTTDKTDNSDLILKNMNSLQTKLPKIHEAKKLLSINKTTLNDFGNKAFETNKLISETYETLVNEMTKIIDGCPDNPETTNNPIMKTDKIDISNLHSKTTNILKTKQTEASKLSSVNKISSKERDLETNKVLPETSQNSENAKAKIVDDCKDNYETVTMPIVKTTDKMDISNLDIQNVNTSKTNQTKKFKTAKLSSGKKTSFKDIVNREFETNKFISETSKISKNATANIGNEGKNVFKTVTIPFVKMDKMDISNLHLKNMTTPKTKLTKKFKTKHMGNKEFERNKVAFKNCNTSKNETVKIEKCKGHSQAVEIPIIKTTDQVDTSNLYSQNMNIPITENAQTLEVQENPPVNESSFENVHKVFETNKIIFENDGTKDIEKDEVVDNCKNELETETIPFLNVTDEIHNSKLYFNNINTDKIEKLPSVDNNLLEEMINKAFEINTVVSKNCDTLQIEMDQVDDNCNNSSKTKKIPFLKVTDKIDISNLYSKNVDIFKTDKPNNLEVAVTNQSVNESSVEEIVNKSFETNDVITENYEIDRDEVLENCKDNSENETTSSVKATDILDKSNLYLTNTNTHKTEEIKKIETKELSSVTKNVFDDIVNKAFETNTVVSDNYDITEIERDEIVDNCDYNSKTEIISFAKATDKINISSLYSKKKNTFETEEETKDLNVEENQLVKKKPFEEIVNKSFETNDIITENYETVEIVMNGVLENCKDNSETETIPFVKATDILDKSNLYLTNIDTHKTEETKKIETKELSSVTKNVFDDIVNEAFETNTIVFDNYDSIEIERDEVVDNCKDHSKTKIISFSKVIDKINISSLYSNKKNTFETEEEAKDLNVEENQLVNEKPFEEIVNKSFETNDIITENYETVEIEMNDVLENCKDNSETETIPFVKATDILNKSNLYLTNTNTHKTEETKKIETEELSSATKNVFDDNVNKAFEINTVVSDNYDTTEIERDEVVDNCNYNFKTEIISFAKVTDKININSLYSKNKNTFETEEEAIDLDVKANQLVNENLFEEIVNKAFEINTVISENDDTTEIEMDEIVDNHKDNSETETISFAKATGNLDINNLYITNINIHTTEEAKRIETEELSSATKHLFDDNVNKVFETNTVVSENYVIKAIEMDEVVDSFKESSETDIAPFAKANENFDINNLYIPDINVHKTEDIQKIETEELPSATKHLFGDIVNKAFETNTVLPENYNTTDIEMGEVVDNCDDNFTTDETISSMNVTDEMGISCFYIKNMNTFETEEEAKYLDVEENQMINEKSFEEIVNKSFETNDVITENYETIEIEMNDVLENCKDNSETETIPLVKANDKIDINSLYFNNIKIHKPEEDKNLGTKELLSVKNNFFEDIGNKAFTINNVVSENYDSIEIERDKVVDNCKNNSESEIIPFAIDSGRRDISNSYFNKIITHKIVEAINLETEELPSFKQNFFDDVKKTFESNIVISHNYDTTDIEIDKIVDNYRYISEIKKISFVKVCNEKSINCLYMENMNTFEIEEDSRYLEMKEIQLVNERAFEDIVNNAFETNQYISENYGIPEIEMDHLIDSCEDNSVTKIFSLAKYTDKIDTIDMYSNNINTHKTEEANNLEPEELPSVNKTFFHDNVNKAFETNTVISENDDTTEIERDEVVNNYKYNSETETISLAKLTDQVDFTSLYFNNINTDKTEEAKKLKTEELPSVNKNFFDYIVNNVFETNTVLSENYNTAVIEMDEIIDNHKDDSNTKTIPFVKVTDKMCISNLYSKNINTIEIEKPKNFEIVKNQSVNESFFEDIVNKAFETNKVVSENYDTLEIEMDEIAENKTAIMPIVKTTNQVYINDMYLNYINTPIIQDVKNIESQELPSVNKHFFEVIVNKASDTNSDVSENNDTSEIEMNEMVDISESVPMTIMKPTNQVDTNNMYLKCIGTTKNKNVKEFKVEEYPSVSGSSCDDFVNKAFETTTVVSNNCYSSKIEIAKVDTNEKDNSETITMPLVRSTDEINISNLHSKSMNTPKIKQTKNLEAEKLMSVNDGSSEDIICQTFETNKVISENYDISDIEMSKIVDKYNENSGNVTIPIVKTTNQVHLNNLFFTNMSSSKNKSVKDLDLEENPLVNKSSFEDIVNKAFETNKSISENCITSKFEIVKFVDKFKENSEVNNTSVTNNTDILEVSNFYTNNINVLEPDESMNCETEEFPSGNLNSFNDANNKVFEIGNGMSENCEVISTTKESIDETKNFNFFSKNMISIEIDRNKPLEIDKLASKNSNTSKFENEVFEGNGVGLNNCNTTDIERILDTCGIKLNVISNSDSNGEHSNAFKTKLSEHLELKNSFEVNPYEIPGPSNAATSVIETADVIVTPGTSSSVQGCSKTSNEANTFNIKDFLLVVPSEMRTLGGIPFINIPDVLKKHIAHDWIMNNKFKKTLNLAQVNSVANLVHEYTESQTSESLNKRAVDFAIFLIQYFNNNVNKTLLYDNELTNKLSLKMKKYFSDNLDNTRVYPFMDHITPKKIWCYTYGVVYLLRLFAEIPTAEFEMNKEKLSYLGYFIQDLIKYLERKHEIYCKSDYVCLTD